MSKERFFTGESGRVCRRGRVHRCRNPGPQVQLEADMVPAFGTNMRSSRICRRNAAFSWLHRSILALVAGFAIPPLTHAQETNWPSKTVTVVVGFGAGGATDVMARMPSRKLSEDLKQAFVVENRVGGAGNVAATYVARRRPTSRQHDRRPASAWSSSVQPRKPRPA